jgi:DNA-binding NarL/FixJ family response regulator
MSEEKMIRILLTDDHSLFRDGLRRLLETESDMCVVGEAQDGQTAISLVESLHPDLLLLDVAMPGMPGLEVLRRIMAESWHPRVILVTAAIHPSQVIRALQLGAHGIVMKESASRVLFDCIRCVLSGSYWVGEAATENVSETIRTLFTSVAKTPGAEEHALTERELEIALAIVDGMSNREIASKFAISERTVKNHLTRIFDKLGVSSRLELGLLAIDRGFVKTGNSGSDV